MTDASRDPGELAQRLTRLESQVGDFQREIAELRELLNAREAYADRRKTSRRRDPEPAAAPPLVKRTHVRTPTIVEPTPTGADGRDLEALLSGRVLPWIGGLAILVGSLFFLRLASESGAGRPWIGPEARVLIGLIAGLAMAAGGAWFFERRERLFGHTLLAVGLGVLNLSLFAATSLYDLIAYQLALGGTFVAAAAGTFIAIRARSQVAAAYGLLPALIAPALLGADPTGVTIAYFGVLLAGTTAVTLYRTWSWLPLLSLLFTFFQVYGWLSDSPAAASGLLVIAGYWTLHTLATGGEDVRRLSDRLRPSSTIIAILNTAITFGAGLILLDGALDEWRGLYLIGLAVIHLPVAGYLLYRGGDRNPYGMLMLGLGLASGAVAVPVQFDGQAVPIAWAAVAVVMAWLYGRLDNQFSLGAGIAFGALALGHFVLFDYRFTDFLSGATMSGYPFVNESGAVLGALLLAIAASAYLARSRDLHIAAILTSAGLLAYALPFEITDGWLIAGWSLIALALTAVNRVEPAGARKYVAAGLILKSFALFVTLAEIATPSRLRVSRFSDVDHFPFWSDATLALISLTTALFAVWLLHRRDRPQLAGIALPAGAALIIYLLSIGLVDEFQKRLDINGGNLDALREQAQVGLSILWTSCGVISFALGVALQRIGMRVFGLALLGVAIVKVFVIDLASLETSYRVISFIALGALLLLASYLYQRIMTRTDGHASSSRSG